MNLSDLEQALVVIATKTLSEVSYNLLTQRSAPLIDVLTYGFVNTPIIHNATGEIIAYVTYWEDRHITVCRLTGDILHLLGVEEFTHWPSLKECEALFCKYWTEQ